MWCFRWLMMGIIGFSVGIVGFLLHQIIDIISEFKWELTSYYIQVKQPQQQQPHTFTTSTHCLLERRLSRSLHIYRRLLSHLRGGLLHACPVPARGRRQRDPRNHRLSQWHENQRYFQTPDADRQVLVLCIRGGCRHARGLRGTHDPPGQPRSRGHLSVQIRNVHLWLRNEQLRRFIVSTLLKLQFNLFNLAINCIKLI